MSGKTRHVNPEGEIIEVLGPASAPGVDMLSIIRKHNLPMEFPEAVEREAERIPEQIDRAEIARREDLRGQIRHHHRSRRREGFRRRHRRRAHARSGWKLGVHIADVSHYVRPGNALDREAQKRGNSTYLADRVIPMLPERLSNGICSLKPGVDRLTMSAFIEFDRQGRVRHATFGRSVIRSAARLTYRQAFAILEGQAGAADAELRARRQGAAQRVSDAARRDAATARAREGRLGAGLAAAQEPLRRRLARSRFPRGESLAR